MKTNLLLSILTNGMIILFILMTPFQGVSAQSDCDQIILDQAGIFGSGLSQVEAAVSQLQQATEVRVITIDSYGSAADLGHYLDQRRQSCPSWQSLNGGMKENLVVFAISMQEHADWIAYGEQWTNPLKANYDRILGDYMDSKFADGDFAGGFAGGINEVYRLLDLKIHPPAQAPVDSGPITIDQRKPVDLSGLYRFLIIALIVIAIIVLLVLGYGWFTKWQEEDAKRRKAQQKAKLKKQSVTTGISELGEHINTVQQNITALASTVDGGVIDRLTSMLREASRIQGQLLQRYETINSTAGDVNDNALTAGQYEEIANTCEDILDLLEKAQHELDEASDATDEIKVSAQQAPDAIHEATIALARASEAWEQTKDEFGVPDSVLLPIQKLITSAQNNIGTKRPDLAYKRALDATEAANSLASELMALPERRKALQKLVSALPDMIKVAQERITSGRKEFDVMDDIFPADALEAIAGNGSQAEKRANGMMRALETLPVLLEKQDFEKVEDLAEKVKTWAAEIDSFMRSITSIHTNLDQAVKAMNKEVADAKADVEKAQKFLRDNQGKFTDSHHEDLSEAEKQLRIALAELDEDLPNPTVVVKAARAANELADAVLSQAREDLEQRQRLLAKMETAQREAERLVSKAGEYIEDHSSDVSSNAKAVLRSAKKDLATALEATDLTRKIAFFEGAEEKARDAYNEAKQDVENAEEEDDSSSSVTVFNNSTSVFNSTPQNNWHAPISNVGGGGHNFGDTSNTGGGGHNFGGQSKTGGGGHKW